MNIKYLFNIISKIMLILAGLMLLPLIVALIYRENPMPFLLTAAILVAVFLPVFLITRRAKRQVYAKEGFISVAASWILMSLFGALPFIFSGSIPSFIDAFFETVSGFTTTGATILGNVEIMPRGILFYRSFTHWIGGMGIIVFMLAILPKSEGAAVQLMRAEVPGPTKGKLVPRLRQTSLILYGIYFVLTAAEVIALLIAKMPLFDALVNSFATTGTGGFSVLNNSIAGYNNPAAEWIIAIFMLLSGINFNIYYFLIIKSFLPIIKNTELKVYLILCTIATVFITLNVWLTMASEFESVGECIRLSFFHVTSIISTTGFVAVNYNLWPELSKAILLLLTLTGACAGSTAGGLKLSRIIIIFKGLSHELRCKLKPNSVKPVKMDGEPLPDATVRSATTYLGFYVAIMCATVILISLDGFDFLTNFSAVATCFNNVGPGLGEIVGPVGNFSAFSDLSTFILTIAMLLGRLEIIPILILFSPSSWKRH